jgi:uncharacterized protein YcbX
MLVSPEGQFLTQRQTPELGRFQLTYNPDKTGFIVTFQGDTITIPLSLDYPNHQTQWASVWDNSLEVLRAESSINQWFSERLQREVVLVYQPNNSPQQVSLADGYPILILSEASLIALQPHEEDTLGTFQLGTTTLQIVKPCSRCILTTIDPIMLERGDEPLRTLSTYRKENNKILFGANALCLNPGKIGISH